MFLESESIERIEWYSHIEWGGANQPCSRVFPCSSLQSAKETVYSVRDGISETITELSKVPDKVQSMAKTIVDFVENIPAFFQ